MERKEKYTGMSKIDAKIRLEYSDETLILRGNFFSKCSKNFSIRLMIMFKVCRSLFLYAAKRIMNVRYVLQNIFKKS